MKEGDLELVLLWRNHPDIRRFMYTQHEISHDENARWFARASRDADRYLLIFEIDETPLGFINIHQMSHKGVAEWGFYVAPNAPKGTGRALGDTAVQYAFETVGFHKLCGEALAYNERSIRFHLSLGFHSEGVLRKQHFDGRLYHDIVCFGLLAEEWRQRN